MQSQWTLTPSDSGFLLYTCHSILGKELFEKLLTAAEADTHGVHALHVKCSNVYTSLKSNVKILPC